MKLRLSLVPDAQGLAEASTEATLASASRFGHFWSLSDSSMACLRQHDGVGGGYAEVRIPMPAPASPIPLQPRALSGDGAVRVVSPSQSFMMRQQLQAQIAPNPDDPAVALIASGLQQRDTYDSLANVPAIKDVTPGIGVPRSHDAALQTLACIVRAVEQGNGSMQLVVQGVNLANEQDNPQQSMRLACCAWAGSGTQALLGAVHGQILCVDEEAVASTERSGTCDGGSIIAPQQITPREVATVPSELGHVISLAVMRLNDGEGILISTTKCLLAVSGQGAVGALRRCGAAPGKWAAAVAIEMSAAAGTSGSQAHLQITQVATVGAAHAVWICKGVLHTFDVAAPNIAVQGSEYAQGAQLLHRDTYSRIQLADELARSIEGVAVLPRYVLLLTTGPGSVSLLHAIWRASGQLAYTTRVYEGIGRPVSLIVDPEDPEVALDAVLVVYVVGTHGNAKVDVEEPALAGAWDSIRAGRFFAAEAQIDAVSASPMGGRPVAESVMWASLGRALLKNGSRLHAARVLGKVLPGVVSADTGDAIMTFQQAVLMFCGAQGCVKVCLPSHF